MSSSHLSIHLRLLGMAALWGASWPWGRVVAQAMPPLASASVRFLLAGIVLLVWLQRSRGLASLRTFSTRQWTGMASAAATGILAYAVCFMLGLQLVPSGKAVVFITLTPALTLLLAALIFREALNWRIGTGMLMAVAGAMVAITAGHPLQLLDSDVGLGELFLLGCVVSWAAYTLIGRVVLAGIDALAVTTVSTLLGAVMLMVASFTIEGAQAWATLPDAALPVWGCVLALALGTTTLAYAWYFDGVKALGAGAASAYVTLVPVFGILFSGLWLGEPMHASLLAGGSVAIAGMVVMHLGRHSVTR